MVDMLSDRTCLMLGIRSSLTPRSWVQVKDPEIGMHLDGNGCSASLTVLLLAGIDPAASRPAAWQPSADVQQEQVRP